MSKKADHSKDKVLSVAVAPLLAPEAFTKLLVSIGLSAKYADGVLKNVKLSNTFVEVCREAGVEAKGCAAATGALLNKIATSLLPEWDVAMANRSKVVRYVMDGKIKSNAQMEKVISYFKKATAFDAKDFEATCGVGIEISAKQITEAVAKAIAGLGAAAGNGWNSQFKLLPEINKALKWADGELVFKELEAQLTAAFGAKPAPGDKKDAKSKGTTPTAAATGTAAAGTAASGTKPTASAAPAGAKVGGGDSVAPATADAKHHAEDEDFADTARDLKSAHNTEEQKRRCQAATKGVVYTRFPPEPNGFLHIGHAKSMRFNFGLAKRRGGGCIMRFDDTNPEAEKKVYIDSIYDSMRWLGHEPVKTTYSSDYFPELYDLAVVLIKKGLAYVDHQTKDQIAEERRTKVPSPWRTRPIKESLQLFEDMRKGKFEEGKATLRLIGDFTSSNPQMWDMVAYRIKYTPHPHAGDKWCIYPSYDYSHCLIDSLEFITYSICTLEFEVRRDSYFWLLDVLDMYKPKVWEFSRLNITHNVMSKRKLHQLVADGYCRGWDDPRLFTIDGLRRRGYTAEAINEFCDKVGVSRTNNIIEIQLLEACARQNLDGIARRAMVVTHPIKVVLTNFDEKKVVFVDANTLPKDKSTHKVPLTRIVYIDAEDFNADSKDAEAKDFYGLTPTQAVRLKYAYVVKCTSFTKNAAGVVTEIQATVDLNDTTTKCKGNLHWVAQPTPGVEPTKVEVRLYDRLFNNKNPAELDDWLADINPHSLQVIPGAYADCGVADAKVSDKFQFERVGYFNVDLDSKAGHLVFNRTVKLKETNAAVAGRSATEASTPAAKSAAAKNKEKQKKEKK